MRHPRRAGFAVLALISMSLLGGCAATVHMEAAPQANDPLCADATVRLQNADTVAGEERRWTDAQSTGAWGENPTAVLFSCGLEAPAPTSEMQCISLAGVDWLVDTSEAPYTRVTTYGRSPAIQVFINTEVVSANDVLANNGIVAAASAIPAERSCTTPSELPEELEEQLGD